MSEPAVQRTSRARFRDWEALRRRARLRRALGGVVLLGPVALVVAWDASVRWGRVAFAPGEWIAYALACVASLVIWTSMLCVVARRRTRASWLMALAFVVLFALALGEQRYFFEQYGAYIGTESSRFAASFGESILNQLAADYENYLAAKLLPLVIALVLVLGARSLVRPRRTLARHSRWLLPVGLAAAFFVPIPKRAAQASTPDLLFFGAAGELALVELGVRPAMAIGLRTMRTPLPVPALTAAPRSRRNVVLFVLEGVRADVTCRVPGRPCRETPYSDRLTPERIPLLQMRALDSATLVSIGVLWTGLGPHEKETAFRTQPVLFDYARAAGWDAGYWTSQHEGFGTLGNWIAGLAASRVVTARDLEPGADLDLGAREDLLAERVCAELPALREPFFGIVQLSGTHFPYRVDPAQDQPFQPAALSKGPDGNAAFMNYYRNSVHQQDRHVARMIECVKRSPAGGRTVLLLTSDHGEAFREHSQLGHTLSVFDEELHVPAWVDAPPGALSPDELVHLRANSAAPTFHVDLTATVLDLMGVWSSPEIARFRRRMLGESLLARTSHARSVPLTNCTSLWGCAFENWGYMRGFRKLEARAWDPDWRCYDLATDPGERNDLGWRACGDLAERARATFGRRPGEAVDEKD